MDSLFARKQTDTQIAPVSERHSVLSLNSRGFHHLSYQDWGNKNSEDTVFCIHGLTRNSHDFDPIAAALVNTERRVICPDTAGRGHSDWLPDHHDYQIKQYNIDFTMVATHVGCEKFDIIGTSLGGMMGMQLAAMRNSPVRRLVVNDVAPEVPHSAMARLGGYLHRDPLFETLEGLEENLRKTLTPFGPMTDEDWKRMAETSHRKVDRGYRLAFDPGISNVYRSYWSLAFFNLWKYWQRITCPVLVLRGTESDFLTSSLVSRMKRKLPHMDLIEFEGVGHTPTLNAPVQIDPILEWLDTH